jgi:hypothetical protein
MKRIFAFFDRYLDPAEQLSQVLFGLIMVLIFTLGAGSLVAEGEDATRDMLLSALGCNLAWGIIQAWMYVIDCVYARSHNVRLIRLVQQSASAEEAIELLRDELDEELEPVTSEEGRTRLYQDIYSRTKSSPLPWSKITRHDLYGAIFVFVLVMATAIPALMPFLVIGNLRLALRVSNGILVGLLFFTGFHWAEQTNTNRWKAGLVIMLCGVALVVLAETLGG